MANTQSTSAARVPLAMDLATDVLHEIVIFLDGSTTAAVAMTEFASAIAKEHAARVIGVFVQPAPPLTNAESFARGSGIREVLGARDSEVESIEERYHAALHKVVDRYEVRSEWRSLRHFSSDVAVNAYYADLVVVARPGAAGPSSNPPGLAESLVLSSGRPIILFPPDGKVTQVRRILVAWNATRESVRAVADALPLLARADAVEVMVIDHERHKESHGREPGADMARHLASHGARVEVRRVSSEGKDVGKLMLSQAAAFKANLLVMGAYGHSQVREWVFGGVTRTVLYEANIPVLMSR